MDLQEIIETQRQFDGEHGWALKSDDSRELLSMLSKDLIGLFGEIGEFANIVKKHHLESEISTNEEINSMLHKFDSSLEEELIDSFIYLIRLASHLDIDIGKAYLKKLTYNEERFKDFANNKQQ